VEKVWERRSRAFPPHYNPWYRQGRSQDFSKGGAEIMEAKAL